MQISINLLRVIFVLSTIVIVTDCCSSRILLLKERTLRIAHTFEDRLSAATVQKDSNASPGDVDFRGDSLELNKFNVSDDEPPPSTPIYDDINYNDTLSMDFTSIRPPLIDDTGENENDGSGDSLLEIDDVLAEEAGDVTSHENMPSAISTTTQSPSINVNQSTGATGATNTSTAAPAGKVVQHKVSILDIYSSILGDILNLDCTGQYLTDFCLNGGRCFRIPLGNHSFFSCECADGYVGERCESKSFNGLFLPLTSVDEKKPQIQTARMVLSFPMLLMFSATYLMFGAMVVFKCPRKPPRAAGMPEE